MRRVNGCATRNHWRGFQSSLIIESDCLGLVYDNPVQETALCGCVCECKFPCTRRRGTLLLIRYLVDLWCLGMVKEGRR